MQHSPMPVPLDTEPPAAAAVPPNAAPTGVTDHLQTHRAASTTLLGKLLCRLRTTPPQAPAARPEPTAANASVPEDRRSYPRRDADCTVTLALLRGVNPADEVGVDWLLHSQGITGELLDLSMNGAAVELDRQLQPEQRLIIRITHRRSQIPLSTTGSVLRTLPAPSGHFKTVIRFVSNLPMQQVQNVVRHLHGEGHV